MSFDAAALAAALEHGPVARVVVAEARGSAPRGAGTEMWVGPSGQHGTIGGGALEWEATRIAREVLSGGAPRVMRMPLGPALGQCCGGSVTLVVERVEAMPGDPWIRRVEGDRPAPSGEWTGLQDGWMREAAVRPGAPLWIWGAGHVGRALVDVLSPLPDLALTWVDIAPDRFPEIPASVTQLVAADPPRLMPRAPMEARHLILTHSHEIDLALCHAALSHGFAECGLIGSETKWARFRSRLAALGHEASAVTRITCPIGDPALGKHPQAIAVGVAAALLSAQHRKGGF
ncbi:xanthine dehydrogenase accessory protein XdhC [Jannaschia aquimarina]|uniref:XdhC and CoxI family protein n=1 Tax=Jannaschia aquimarina TaxID=935700 RepID=A0A0D1ELP1_9RHOB|nr:xanthine dehydrogenase accessory protein XdhC [Jannaschia aquimarina]KIT17851.1 XdhC and CoxI family protein [Jannaschia aquimarina]SNS56447.1 molybdenum cofactor sulfurylase [Jannaschia aquimarina]